MNDFFTYNRPIMLFAYGQVFFVLGLAIFLQSRRHSRLRLARDLRWLAAFGLLHGLHEWGWVFIPIQSEFLAERYITLLQLAQLLLLASSFTCLLVFGSLTVAPHRMALARLTMGLTLGWSLIFITVCLTRLLSDETWYRTGAIWARYLIGFPGAILAAWGFYTHAQTELIHLSERHIYRMLQIAGMALVAYAFWAGLVVREDNFFPANVLNQAAVEGYLVFPVEVFRSLSGLALTVSMIRALEMFDIEVDRMIEDMEIHRIQAEERDRIGQEIHDGAIQAIYSAGLLVKSAQQHADGNSNVAVRLDRAQQVLDGAVTDLRQYMISLRAEQPLETLAEGLRRLAADPRFGSLLDIQVQVEETVPLTPTQVGHALSIVQESLANTARHAHARHVTICLCQQSEGFSLRIEDDGRGFDQAAVVPGFGLRAMRDRARLLGHPLTIRSQPGKGTTIILLIAEHEAAKL
jgi:signal transduction histidine kinase